MAYCRVAWSGVVSLALVALSGCGDNSMAEVKGTVTWEGAPLASGALRFQAVDGNSPTTGGAIKDGQYLVKVPVGKMKVSITAPKVVGQKKVYDTPDSPVRPVTAELLPAKYNEQSELIIDVTPGTVEKNFDLRSK